MTPRARFASTLLTALLALSGLAAHPARAQESQPLMVGVCLAMTGQAAMYGQMLWRGMQVANRMRPKAAGRPLELVLADNKSDSVEAVSATSRLIQKDQVLAVLGPGVSSSALAAGSVAESAQVPMICPAATNQTVTQGKRFVFRTCFTDAFQGQAAARYAFNELKAKTAALVVDVGQDYSVGLASFFKKEFERLGGKVVAQAKVSSGDQEFSAPLGQIQTLEPQLVFLPLYPNVAALLVRQAREMGLSAVFMGCDGLDAPEMVSIGGPAANGIYLTAHFDRQGATGPLAQEFLAAFAQWQAQEGGQESMTGFHALGAEAYLTLVDALERSHGQGGEALRQALASTKDLANISGLISMDADNNARKGAVVLKIDHGRFNYVTTIRP